MTDLPAQAPVKGGVVPYLQVDGAVKAANFYVKAFGAQIAAMAAPAEDGRTMHVHLYINDGSVMLSDPYPEHGIPLKGPGGFSCMLPLTTGIDAAYQRAVDAGAEATMPPQDMFWGDRYGQVTDPFGIIWAMNQGKS